MGSHDVADGYAESYDRSNEKSVQGHGPFQCHGPSYRQANAGFKQSGYESSYKKRFSYDKSRRASSYEQTDAGSN